MSRAVSPITHSAATVPIVAIVAAVAVVSVVSVVTVVAVVAVVAVESVVSVVVVVAVDIHGKTIFLVYHGVVWCIKLSRNVTENQNEKEKNPEISVFLWKTL